MSKPVARSRQGAWHEPAPLSFLARRPSYPWMIVGTVCIGAFMGMLDASIAQLVLPELEIEFRARVSQVSWVAVAYLLTVAALLPIFGRLADLMGRKLLYCGGFLLFIFGSALCGFAPDLPALVAARVFQGVGAALAQANSVAIILAAVGDRRRGRAIGVQAAAQAVGLSAGPALGGLLISSLGWRWVFFINVPVGLLGTILGLLILPQTRREAVTARFDWGGAILLTPALTALMTAVNEAARWGLASPALIGCLLLAVGLLAGFIWRELKSDSPLLDLSLFRDLGFSAGNLAGLLASGTLFGMFFLLPVAFERIYRLSSLEAGFRLTVIPIMIGCLAPVSGRLSDRLGPRALTVGGMAMILAGLLLLLAALDGSPDMLWLVTLALAVFGIGQGLFTAPNNSAIMAGVPQGETGEAGGLLNLMRSLGTSTGIATAAAVLSWQLAALPGHSAGTLHAPRADLIAASHAVIAVFAGFALIAGAASLVRGRG